MVDEIVSDEVLAVLEVAEFDLLDAALKPLDESNEAVQKTRQQKLQRFRYEAERAETQYQLCDPHNRKVASELERRWEEAMKLCHQAEQDACDQVGARRTGLNASLRQQWHVAGEEIKSLWGDGRLSNEHKKRIVRSVVDKVVLATPQCGKLRIRIVWKSGMLTDRKIDVEIGSLFAPPDGEKTKREILRLAHHKNTTDEFIAHTLSRQGLRGPHNSTSGSVSCEYAAGWIGFYRGKNIGGDPSGTNDSRGPPAELVRTIPKETEANAWPRFVKSVVDHVGQAPPAEEIRKGHERRPLEANDRFASVRR